MIRKITLFFLFCIGISQTLHAQAGCGFDNVNNQLKTKDPAFAKAVQQLNTDIAQWISTHSNSKELLTTGTSSGDTIFEIPVVVHVMHTGGSVGSIYNISDQKIIDAIDFTNKIFEANLTGVPGPGSGGTKFPVRFVLAKRSPVCTATNGIVRRDVSATYSNYTNNGINQPGGPNTAGVDDADLKALSIWPNDRYYNIWVVNRIDGVDGYSPGSFIAGYAYLPGAGPAIDGTIILASQMDANRYTLPHEIGHAWGLEHTFRGSNPATSTCPTNTTCATQGDYCCDTQPHYLYGAGTCYAGQSNPCVSGNFDDATAKNYMNYTSCRDRFTPDQRTRFLGVMNSGVSNRSSLISSSGSLALPTTALPTVCVPTAPSTGPTMGAGPATFRISDANRYYIDVYQGSYNGTSNLHYMDYTCNHQIRLKAGNTYSFHVASSPSAGERNVLFIDYNNDGTFGNSAGERIDANTTNGGTFSGSFTVPTTATTCSPIRLRLRGGRTTSYIDSCSGGLNGQTEDYEVLIYGTGTGGATQLTLDKPPRGGNPSCFDTELMFKARPTNTGITVINYKWFRNSAVVQPTQVGDTLKWDGFQDKDTVKAMLYYVGLCGVDSVMSDSIVVNRVVSVAPAVTIGITGGTNPTCIDDTVTFSVISNINPGSAPTYQWRSNGSDIIGATGTTFKAIGRGGETITVRMNSSAGSCASPGFAISNGIQITYTQKAPVVSIALTVGTNPGCAGQNLQFTATPVTAGGTSPQYQWLVNGFPAGTGATFSSSTLNHNDQVRAIMTSNSACATTPTATSNTIAIVHETITADITIAQSLGTNPSCEGKSVLFSANTNNSGKNPGYQWMVNGSPITNATQPVYFTDSLKNNDIVQCILIATDPCVTNPLDTSSGIAMLITPANRPSVSFSITTGKNPGCLDSFVEFTAVAKDLGVNPEFTWMINGFPGGSGNTFSSSSFLNNNIISVRANQTDGACYLPDTVYSDSMVMVRSVTPKAPVISLIGNMMYTNFDSSFVWFGPDGQMPDGPKGKAYPGKIGFYWAVTNNNGCWSKPSNYLGITLLDITSLDISGLEVYPNPTSDKVILDWNNAVVNYTVTVHNSIGQVVMTEKAENVSRKEINMANLAAGNYFIMLKDSEGKVGVVKVTLNNN